MKTFYLIGIGGISMSAIALYLKAQKFKVLGSDIQKSPQTEILEKNNIKVFYEQDANNIKDDIDLIIYTSGVGNKNSPGYVELKKAQDLKIPTYKRAEFLGKLFNQTKLITIAGTHGKTTTTGMLGKILIHCKLEPTIFIGTNVREFANTNLYIGKSKLTLLEACEYDRSFLEFKPDIAVITNIEAEHLDYFKDGIVEIREAFQEYIEKIKSQGTLIAFVDKNIDAVLKKIKRKDIKIVRYAQKTNSDIVKKLNLKIPGEHNLDNALAAYFTAKELNLPSEKIIQDLNQFSGTNRRAELIFENSRIKVFDDYAHHPTEIQATLRGFRKKYPKFKILCIFQPHQYSRTKFLFSDLVKSFTASDELILAPIYEVAGREEKKQTNSRKLAAAIAKIQPSVTYLEDFKKIANLVLKKLDKPNKDVIVITMGAGNIYEVGKILKTKLQNQ